MADIIFLTDFTVSSIISTKMRNSAPYVLSNILEHEGYDVMIIDHFTSIPNIFEVIERYLDKNTFMIALSTTFLTFTCSESIGKQKIAFSCELNLWQEKDSSLKDWFSNLKSLLHKYNPNGKIIVGGRNVHNLYRFAKYDAAIYSDVDYFVLGRSVNSITTIASLLKENKDLPVIEEKHGLKYVYYPSQITAPNTTIFKPKWKIQPGELLPIETARGCPFNCKFCAMDKLLDLPKSPESLKQELIHNYEHFGVTNYIFADDCINGTKQKIENICNTIMSLPFKINWSSYARMEIGVKYPETMDMIAESGAKILSFGIESFSYEALKNVSKGLHPEKVKENLSNFKNKFGNRCLIHTNWIVGLPGETEKSIMDTINWVVNAGVVDSISVNPLAISKYYPEFEEISSFSAFSKYPEKYGLKVEYNEAGLLTYWEHDTMNSVRAVELATLFEDEWKADGRTPLFKGYHTIPLFLSYGFTWEELLEGLNPISEEIKDRYRNKYIEAEKKMLQNYRNDLMN